MFYKVFTLNKSSSFNIDRSPVKIIDEFRVTVSHAGNTTEAFYHHSLEAFGCIVKRSVLLIGSWTIGSLARLFVGLVGLGWFGLGWDGWLVGLVVCNERVC